MTITEQPARVCQFCPAPAANRSAKTCGGAPCRLRLRWHTEATARFAVYRHFDIDDVLLYVGCTVDPARRRGEHDRTSPWAGRIHRTETVWFDAMYAARCEESLAVLRERPVYNVKCTRTSYGHGPYRIPDPREF